MNLIIFLTVDYICSQNGQIDYEENENRFHLFFKVFFNVYSKWVLEYTHLYIQNRILIETVILSFEIGHGPLFIKTTFIR